MSLRFFTRILGFASLLVAGLPLQAAAYSAASGTPPISLRHLGPLVTLQGSLLPRLAAAHRGKALAASTTLEVDIALRVRDPAGLDRFLHDVYDPKSPLFHHFLTPTEFAARFAPPAADRSVVDAWLQQRGMHVTAQAANGLLIQARGQAGDAGKAFGTRLYHFVHGHDSFYANATPVRIPRALAGVVMSVNGLDNAGKMRPAGLHSVIRPKSVAHDAPNGLGPSDLRSIYDMNPLYAAGLNGASETIAVSEFADFVGADTASYDQQFGLGATAPQRVQVPYNNEQAKTGGDGQAEAELDIEVVHAIAPAARLLVYVSPESKGAGLVQGNRMVSDDLATVISISWGFPESYIDTSFVSSFDQILREAASQGQAVFVASGDSGAYDALGWFPKGDPRNKALAIDFPSSDPWSTAVGGTTLNASGGTYNSESVWSKSSDGSGSGGGLSQFFHEPDWQTGPGVANSFSNGMRQSPDVSADADPSTGYAVYTLADSTTGWHEFGGTSAAAPLWAAYMILLQQQLKTTIGFLNPTLYALGQKAGSFHSPPYHDITGGNNLHYPATTGWDFGTGWGSMDGAALLSDIIAMGGPVITRPSPGSTPIVFPTSSAGTISFHVIAHWAKKGSKGGPNSKGITSSKRGVKVQLDLFFTVDSAPAGLPVTASFVVSYKGKNVSHSTKKGTLDPNNPTGTYGAQKAFAPSKKGIYTFLGKVSMGGQTVARQATLNVK